MGLRWLLLLENARSMPGAPQDTLISGGALLQPQPLVQGPGGDALGWPCPRGRVLGAALNPYFGPACSQARMQPGTGSSGRRAAHEGSDGLL